MNVKTDNIDSKAMSTMVKDNILLGSFNQYGDKDKPFTKCFLLYLWMLFNLLFSFVQFNLLLFTIF